MRIRFTLGRILVALISKNVRLYRWYVKYKPDKYFWRHPFDGCDLLVDGAGGSALTSFVNYIEKWNPHLRISHHCHVPAPIEYCLDENIPCVVCVRNPVDQFSSFVARTQREGEWINFWFFFSHYKFVFRHRDSILLAKFDDIISRPDEIVRSINKRFGLVLSPGDGQAEKVRTTVKERDK